MPLNEQQVQHLIARGEDCDMEFKACTRRLDKDICASVCAFLNRSGGTLLLGVSRNGSIRGIAPEAVEEIRTAFAAAVSDPRQLMPPVHLCAEPVTVKSRTLLVIRVPESARVHHCHGRIYDRSEAGNTDVTDHTDLVAQLYLRKQSDFTENRVFTRVQPRDLRADLIERCRRHVRINHKQHPWAAMDDTQLLKSARLLQLDRESGQRGVTLAGILLFGPDELILQVCPQHRTDCLLRKVNVERCDDRDLIRTNLLDSYTRILAFVRKHLPDPFCLEGVERCSLRDRLAHELASNLLIHREYSSGVPARLIIEYGRISTWNASRSHSFGPLDPATTVPAPKNPVIASVFRELDLAAGRGRGLRTLWRYGKKYGGCDPQLQEGDVFHACLSVPEFSPRFSPKLSRLP